MEGKLVAQGRRSWSSSTDADGKPRHRGSGKDLSYCDDLTNERFVPHVIEPSAGADRATLAFLCEAYHEDKAPDENGKMQTRVVMKFHPRMAPIKAAVFPLVKKDGMPEVAQKIYRDLKKQLQRLLRREGGRRPPLSPPGRGRHAVSASRSTARRCTDGTVTIRDRDTLKQWRVHENELVTELRQRYRLREYSAPLAPVGGTL